MMRCAPPARALHGTSSPPPPAPRHPAPCRTHPTGTSIARPQLRSKQLPLAPCRARPSGRSSGGYVKGDTPVPVDDHAVTKDEVDKLDVVPDVLHFCIPGRSSHRLVHVCEHDLHRSQ